MQMLTTASTLMCPHGGSVLINATQQSVTAGGAPVVRPEDVFTVAGCPLNVSGAPHPCLTVEWVSHATRAKAAGGFVLTTASVGLCKAGDGAPQGAVLIQQTQPKASAQ